MCAEREEPGEEAGEVLEGVRGRAGVRVGDVEEGAGGREVEEVAEDGGGVAQVCRKERAGISEVRLG